MEEDADEKIVQETRLVIGVDFGTTFTDIDVLTDWAPQMQNEDKIPSVISYSDPSPERELQWGASVSPEAVTMIHTKLELDIHSVSEELDLTIRALDGMKNLHFQHIKSSRGIRGLPGYTHKSPEEIVTDYLTKVFESSEREVDKFAGGVRDSLATDIVVTIPTGWSYMAMNSTYRALTKSGFGPQSFPMLREVLFISEPEAAAIYTARSLKEEQGEDFLKENGYFVLCDAGGGTIDVVSYKVKQLQPTLQLQEIGYPTGRKAGSIFINAAFKVWLRKLLGEKYYSMIDPTMVMNKIASHTTEGKAMRQLMRAFDAIKTNFTGDSGEEFTLDLPEPLENLNIPGVVDFGLITLKGSQVERFFDACVEQVVDLIKGHMFQIEARGGRPKNVFLVGGFGESVYLQRQIEYTLSLWDIKLRRPNKSWTAVVQGAVISGIEKSSARNLRRAGSCRHHYGISLSKLFSDVYSPQQDLVVDKANGLAFAQGQLIWLLNKGDLVLHNQERKAEQDILLTFLQTEARRKVLPIYRYSDDDRPTRFRNAMEELYQVASLTIDLSNVDVKDFEFEKGHTRNLNTYKALVKLTLVLKNNRLKASIWWKGAEVAVQDGLPY
ncbi:actin-like ATPase domain-containing protein [Lojkania enalia]|uniref:Actin-like ATPase domain-containing protein n=1 Tax=Lojkania enalia TaxID=147567 RepID=A0A9P4KHK4_9PLEO|nr:actin-like ATPase domain-containing protein [Didymosphaeria enalia]